MSLIVKNCPSKTHFDMEFRQNDWKMSDDCYIWHCPHAPIRLLSRAEHFKFVEMKRRMERQWTGQGEWSGGVATNLEWFSAKGYHLTGLCTDVVQVRELRGYHKLYY